MTEQLPFYQFNEEDDGHFYALAYCEACYVQRKGPEPVHLILYCTPSAGYSRYVYAAIGADGYNRMISQGPDYSVVVEAALLDIWVSEGVPAYTWQLYPRDAAGSFARDGHEAAYDDARNQLALALYGPRMKAWTQHSLNVSPLITPPAGGFQRVNAYAATEDNAELLQAATNNKP